MPVGPDNGYAKHLTRLVNNCRHLRSSSEILTPLSQRDMGWPDKRFIMFIPCCSSSKCFGHGKFYPCLFPRKADRSHVISKCQTCFREAADDIVMLSKNSRYDMLRSFALHWSLLLLGVKARNVANQERFEDNPFFSKMQDISGYINKDVHTCTQHGQCKNVEKQRKILIIFCFPNWFGKILNHWVDSLLSATHSFCITMCSSTRSA